MLPYQITRPMSWWYVSPRVPSMMAPLIAALAGAALDGWRRLVMAPMILARVILPLTLARLYRDFSHRNAAFMQLVEPPRRRARTSWSWSAA